MTVFKRYIDLECTAGQIKEVTSITIPNGIEISVDFRTTAWLTVSYRHNMPIFIHSIHPIDTNYELFIFKFMIDNNNLYTSLDHFPYFFWTTFLIN